MLFWTSRLASSGIGEDLDAAARRIGTEDEVDGLVVHQQRIGQGVVGPVVLAVEGARIQLLPGEPGVVDDQVAVDDPQAAIAQLALQEPGAAR